jgi:hypothetical protein
MSIDDLNDEEWLVLGGLVRLLVRADGSVSAEERAHLEDIAEQLGADDFWTAVERAQIELPDAQAVKVRAQGVERRPAQEIIYGVLMDLAMTGAILGAESDILDWLAQQWGIESTIEDEPN